MAESNLPKQDFAPPWLKFPTTDSSKTSSQSSHQSDRHRQRREDPYHSRSDYNRLHRQTSFDFHDAKRYPHGQGKYRHHSVDDDYYGYPYGYGYYAPSYNYEKYGMQYGSQPSLARSGSRDGKYAPGRFPQMNGADFSPHYELYEPSYRQGPTKRGYYDKDHSKDGRDSDGRSKARDSDRDRPFSDDFPSLVGSGETTAEVKPTKPGSGVWENPPKSSRNDESTDLLKNTSPGIYKALVPSKNGQVKKNGREGGRMSGGGVRDSSPLSPSNKPNHKEGTRQSPTPDLAIVTQPKKLGDKKSDFLRALRNESSLRNGDVYQDLNQNAIDKKQPSKDAEGMSVNENSSEYMNGEHEDSKDSIEKPGVFGGKINGDVDQHVNGERNINGEALVSDVDHINLSGEEEEKRLLLSMGWVEEDNTEYVITDDEIREFQHLLQNHCRGQKNGLKTTLRNALSLKVENHITNGLVNGTHHEKEKNDKNKPL